MPPRCACNWTSYMRDDVTGKVPALEKYKCEHHTNPKDLKELAAFGDTLETGDILIMHCTHSFGKMAQLATFSPWDHVAMVVKVPMDDDDDTGSSSAVKTRMALISKKAPPPSSTMPWPEPKAGGVEVFEAMGGGVFLYDFVANAICRGKFFKYTAVRRLRNAKGEPLHKEARQKLETFIQECWARPYEEGTAGLMEIARPVFRMKKIDVHKKRDKSLEKLDQMFCSELIAEAYQAAGLLPEETLNSNEILPCMFAPNKAVDQYLAIEKHGYKLGEVEIFKAPKTPLSNCILAKRKELRERQQRGESGPVGYVDDEGDPKPEPKMMLVTTCSSGGSVTS